MSSPDAAAIQAVLAEIKDPENGLDLVKNGQVKDLQVADDRIECSIGLTTHSAPIWEETRQAIIEKLQAKAPNAAVEVKIVEHDRPPLKLGETHLKCKSVIAVGSGKGGVGKSTVATSLAMTLQKLGSKVGLLDADVYGPSIPHMTGTTEAIGAVPVDEGMMSPVVADGLAMMSIGYHVPPDQAVVWRGPMLHRSLTQLLNQTKWGDLDYLIVDMPPGTGDVAISLSQAIPATGAVVVCTPQEVALLDAVKAIGMFGKVNIKVLGMVENMSGFVAPDNQRFDIFGSGGARKKAEELDVPFLGEVPVVIDIRVNGDEGKTSDNLENPAVAPYFESIARSIVRNLARDAAANPTRPSLPVL